MLSFDPPQIIDRFNLDSLDPIRRAQFYVAIGLAVGTPEEGEAGAEQDGMPSPEVLEQQLRRCEGMFYYWEWYRGHEGGRYAYDGWFLGGDCGSVFHADSAIETGVVMTQSSIYAESKHPEVVELAAAVRAAYRDARPKYDRQANRAYWSAYQAKLGREIEEGEFGED